jgi:NTP pyrophosphatase (non-canonical NTP hydrolase)
MPPKTEQLKLHIDIEEPLERLKTATREANEAAQNLRQAKKDVEATWKQIQQEIEDVIAQHVSSGLKGYNEAVQEAIKKAEKTVYKRFDDLCDILLGEDARVKGEPLRVFAERIADIHRQRAMRCLGVDNLEQYTPERGEPVSNDEGNR